MRGECRHEHQGVGQEVLICTGHWMPTTQQSVKERQLSARRRMEGAGEGDHWLEHTELKALGAGHEMAVSLSITCTHTMVIASLCRG
jgi:hypothetical protein